MLRSAHSDSRIGGNIDGCLDQVVKLDFLTFNQAGEARNRYGYPWSPATPGVSAESITPCIPRGGGVRRLVWVDSDHDHDHDHEMCSPLRLLAGVSVVGIPTFSHTVCVAVLC